MAPTSMAPQGFILVAYLEDNAEQAASQSYVPVSGTAFARAPRIRGISCHRNKGQAIWVIAVRH